MNAEPLGLKTEWPTPCRSGGVRQPEVYGDEFCVYNPPDPAATETFDGDAYSFPRAYPGGVAGSIPCCDNNQLFSFVCFENTLALALTLRFFTLFYPFI